MDERLSEHTAAFPKGTLETLERMAEAPNYNAWLLERSEPYLGRRVLDVGAGTGTFTEALAREHDVVALEPDPALFEILRRRLALSPNVNVSSLDAASLASSNVGEPFDSIVCFNVLEHIAADREALEVFMANLRPGGHLLLLVPAHPSLFGSTDVTAGHERRYQREPLRALLEDVGFRPDVLRYVNPVGGVGWFVSARLLKRKYVPTGPLRFYDRLVPLLRTLDHVDVGFGLSLWAAARRPALGADGEKRNTSA
jgi:SAM-dependent methyltransferase